ncbi:hypothetical protein DIURU_004072 [Diutina rugosa]|uniref:diphosphoinositol-polyphosphate diphosphatase n=1 Tax=Diutina rugosa TaxID=5481 RepID=A0A642UIV7_DIURU|nr:uncharacterized protein DIURU_004072 [Diutina rugosa]KAA8899815.1 hypothetical protein DIURU_004072 [Diutina rugosa]
MEIPFDMDEDGLVPSVTPRFAVVESASATLPRHLRGGTGDDIATSTTEDDMRFDEDADDKLDPALVAELHHEFQRQQQQRGAGAKQTLTPPENFAPVIDTIYRSSFPQPANFEFLKTLRLKSVLCLIPEEYPDVQQQFLDDNGIRLFQLGMSGNKEPFVIISAELITEAAKIVLNPANHPILIHCNRGKHRTGCLVGVLRRLQQWSLSLIFDEYRKFAAPKERSMDQQFIELYNDAAIRTYALDHGWLPLLWDSAGDAIS